MPSSSLARSSYHIIYMFMYGIIMQILVSVGTKLELVIMEMAQQIQDKTTVVRGAPVVEPTNDFFWFSRPHWILFLIHFTLFEVNSPSEGRDIIQFLIIRN